MNGIPTSASPPAFHFKASRQPMLWAAVAYSLGIVAGVYLWRPHSVVDSRWGCVCGGRGIFRGAAGPAWAGRWL
jgi:hypothetical protein